MSEVGESQPERQIRWDLADDGLVYEVFCDVGGFLYATLSAAKERAAALGEVEAASRFGERAREVHHEQAAMPFKARQAQIDTLLRWSKEREPISAQCDDYDVLMVERGIDLAQVRGIDLTKECQ